MAQECHIQARRVEHQGICVRCTVASPVPARALELSCRRANR
jgi:hypothetical protein